ncbi:hypothetical protein Pelo_2799 [Pelomyxa schiedti]|nr:hypothetical protein Pelo_2799 [Pelomyxa schiedti]
MDVYAERLLSQIAEHEQSHRRYEILLAAERAKNTEVRSALEKNQMELVKALERVETLEAEAMKLALEKDNAIATKEHYSMALKQDSREEVQRAKQLLKEKTNELSETKEHHARELDEINQQLREIVAFHKKLLEEKSQTGASVAIHSPISHS